MEPIKRSVPDGTHLLRFSTHPTLKLAQVPQWNLDAGIAEQRLADIRRPGRKAPGGQRRVPRTGPSAPLSAGTISNPEQRSGADHREPMLAVINDCMFFRDCIIRCLKVSYTDKCICPFAQLPADWEAYLARLSGNARQKIRRMMRLVEPEAEYHITHATPETFDQDLERLLKFWEAKWKPRKGDRIHDLVRSNRVMLNLSFRAGLLFLPTLWQGQRPLIALATFVDPRKRTFFVYLTGRDETFDGPSTGRMLHAHSIRHAIENGFSQYDFMRGNEPYKYSFGVQERRIRYIGVATRTGANLGQRIDSRTVAEVLEQATTLHRAGKTPEAERAYRQFLQVDTKNPDALHRLGQLLATKGDYVAAMQLFKTLVGIRPELYKPWHYLAQCCEALGRDFDAANAYREVIRIRPDQPEAFAGLARLLIRMGRMEDVNSALLNALSGTPSLQNSPGQSNKSRQRMQ